MNNELCQVPGKVLFLGHCVSPILINTIVLILVALVAIYVLLKTSFFKINNRQEAYGRISSRASYKPLPEQTYEQIAVHELGHAFVVMNYPSLINDAFLQIFNKDIETFNQGYVYYQLDTAITNKSPEILELKMHILLGGMQAEKHYYEGNCLTFGSQSDLNEWMRLAQIYLLNQDDLIFYSHPQNQYEHQHNLSLLMGLKEKHIRNLAAFFNANSELFAVLVNDVMKKRYLGYDELLAYSTQIIKNGHMP